MASDDETDFHARVQVLTDNNAELFNLNLRHKQLLMILIGLIGVFVIVSLALKAIDSKDITKLTGDIVKVVDIVGGNRSY